MAYKEFSYYYDYFNYNADYDALAAQIIKWAAKYAISEGIACDLGCGTGELAFRLYQQGYDVIAVDNSEEMLDVLMDKKYEHGYDKLLILRQDITCLDMYGTVDLFTCTFDTVNHLEGPNQVQKLFDRVALFMHPDGVFIFDMNTAYKHCKILGDHQFHFSEEEATCIWQNKLEQKNNRTKISIEITDNISKENAKEEFYEYFYSLEEIENMLKKSNLYIEELIDGESFEAVSDTSQRYLFMVKKER